MEREPELLLIDDLSLRDLVEKIRSERRDFEQMLHDAHRGLVHEHEGLNYSVKVHAERSIVALEPLIASLNTANYRTLLGLWRLYKTFKRKVLVPEFKDDFQSREKGYSGQFQFFD